MATEKQRSDFEQAYVVEAETFRDSVGTMDNTGKRKWVFPRKPKGKYTNYRNIVSTILLIVFFVLPFLKINGNPVLKFNILDREFFIFGQPFYPQDFFILTIGAITGLIFITLFTVVFGRIFCGWICPQTIFMESVFRKIEYLIEGDRNKQMRLDAQPWNTEKIWKRGLKWSIFILISLIISHLMFSYIVGYERVLEIMKEGPVKNYDNFLVMILFSAAFYFVFAWFREQVCTLVCPYGRLQGVLIDKKTINVFYDFKRGENRSKWRKGEDRKAAGKGDCIDCGQCVVVCPTGIDIRNGQQLECINCTACIDACDEVMDKVGLPKGLIRYASEDEIEKGEKFKFTTRMKAYAAVLVLLVVGSSFLILNRSSVEGKFIKPAGSTYYVKDNRTINVYNYTLLNKSNEDKVVTIKIISPQNGEIEVIGGVNKIIMKRDISTKGTINISFPSKEINLSKQNIVIGVYDQKGALIDSYETYFEGPFKMTL
ncbi:MULTISPECIES: cytochrome c oxidase accessory protein CcoG [Elizabethkingia]|uniref:Type cbb3 cytochrome oxidase biogenesis protein CcoG, involved in Cu oxidation n=3 Tax=Elizabethkingia anophelis TaxID=1117645 RepID=A0A077EJM7_9FLAO|nr:MULTISPECIES: cytochrome c oxidase accessory protein CcoG [Elizabethkingia]AIL47652.1 Type cbb3 cytochrome oxidase biogenesis protein CcoG, involved in Cu oxidation [Elizabethkingia anophelis NUHP1]AQW94067.1 cytochrome c oxidase accessory protein CcoG [Elizabethkingia anophelis]AQX01170.1 cytochrome c oxidase accessory protein CcoG [Elizabethkingia anophelis]ATC36616.1 cytochrome c oxidase accessory protein CcoG [Elizabethkingia anophelis R26]ATC40293.1 cytochrome c oxidase accessory prote